MTPLAPNSWDEASNAPLTSFDSFDFVVELLESSRSRFGVRVILRVSTLSSLKNESVFRSVPLLDLPFMTSSAVAGALMSDNHQQLMIRRLPCGSEISSFDGDNSVSVLISRSPASSAE